MTSKTKCDLCGSPGRRFCPAREAVICAVCCGSGRGSSIDCPDGCPHYPFAPAGYNSWLRIDETLTPKIFGYVMDHYGKDVFEEVIRRMNCGRTPDDQKLNLGAGTAMEYLLCAARDKQGQSLAERWEAAGGAGLSNDERVMMRYRKHSRATIIEIQKVLDHQSMSCIDLLEPDRRPFLLIDRSTAARAKRFTRLLTWLTHYPYFSRPGFSGVEIPDLVYREYFDSVEKNSREAARKHPGLTIKDCLSENFGFYCDLTFELSSAKRKALLQNMDVHHCVATYDVHDYPAVERILDDYPDFEWDDRDPERGDHVRTRYYCWLRRGESKLLEEDMPAFFRHENEEDGVGNLGNVKLSPGKFAVETFSKQKYAFAKKMAEKYFGPYVTLRGEKVVDLARQAAERKGDNGPLEKPEESGREIPKEVEQALIEQFYLKHYKKFLDGPVPMLDGHTPRQAAADPALRPRLVELMKGHLRNMDKLNAEKGFQINIDRVLDELSLGELK